RSARSRNVRSSAPFFHSWMSSGLSPSPRPLSGSLLSIETSSTFGSGSQISVTVIVALISTSLWSGGQSTSGDSATVSTGACVSWISTVCVAWPVFPEPSVADQSTVRVPRGNPRGKRCAASSVGTSAPSHTSVAAAFLSGSRFTGVPVGPAHSAVTLGGAVTTGAVVSTTLTLVHASSYCLNVSITLYT